MLSTVPSGEETMLMRRVSSKDRIPNGLLGCAVVSGLGGGGNPGWRRNCQRHVPIGQRHQHIRFGMHEQPAQLRVRARPQQGSDRRRALHRRHCDRHGQRRDRRGIPYRRPRNRPRHSTSQPTSTQGRSRVGGGPQLCLRRRQSLANAEALGNLAIAATQGDDNVAFAGRTPTDIGNVALSLGNGTRTMAGRRR